jgi:hypothetical protein
VNLTDVSGVGTREAKQRLAAWMREQREG